MDVRLINPFMAAVKNAFATMLGANVLIGKPRLKERDEQATDVSAIIGFAGEATGSVALCFPLNVGLRAAAKFADVEITTGDPILADALGELANMVAGQAKAKMEGLNINISLPRVVLGEEMKLLNSENAPVLVLPCDSQLGRFRTEVTMILARQPTRVCS